MPGPPTRCPTLPQSPLLPETSPRNGSRYFKPSRVPVPREPAPPAHGRQPRGVSQAKPKWLQQSSPSVTFLTQRGNFLPPKTAGGRGTRATVRGAPGSSAGSCTTGPEGPFPIPPTPSEGARLASRGRSTTRASPREGGTVCVSGCVKKHPGLAQTCQSWANGIEGGPGMIFKKFRHKRQRQAGPVGIST